MTFEVFKADDGKFRWRLRDADGEVVRLPRPGKMKVPGTAAEKRRSRAAMQQVLAERYKAQTARG